MEERKQASQKKPVYLHHSDFSSTRSKESKLPTGLCQGCTVSSAFTHCFLSMQGSGRGVWTLSTAWYDVAPSMVFTNAYPGFKPKCNSRDSIAQISERYV